MSNTNTEMPQDKVLLSIDERILAIEAALQPSQRGAPGTTIQRVLKEKEGYEWVLALGGLMLPKTAFHGPTIDDVVSQGEAAVAEMQKLGMNRLMTPWDDLDSALTEALTTSVKRQKGRDFEEFAVRVAAAMPAKRPRKKKGA